MAPRAYQRAVHFFVLAARDTREPTVKWLILVIIYPVTMEQHVRLLEALISACALSFTPELTARFVSI